MIEKIHVYDMDGVLVDTSHRYRNLPDGRIDLEYWFANRTPEKIAQDKLLPLATQYKTDLADPQTYVVICTSRMMHKYDLHFISTVLGMPNKLCMRAVDDTRNDAIIKRQTLSRLFNLRQFKNLPRFFWDDNKINIEACKHLFTKCIHIKSNIAYTQ